MISAADVKKLRDMTGAGMMDCKKALTESNGDFEAAVDYLRKKGQKVSAKRSDRDANEGVVVSQISDDATMGALVEVNCETDFVARNDEFQQFAKDIMALVIANKPADLDALKATAMADGTSVGDQEVNLMGKIGEKIQVRRFVIIEDADGQVVPYTHPGARLGVLVAMTKGDNSEAAGRDVAMQVAAMNPVAAKREEVSSAMVEKEIEIAKEAARNEGKPDNIIEKIAVGKLERFYKDNVLVEQAFVKDSSKTVSGMLEEQGVHVNRFERFALGE